MSTADLHCEYDIRAGDCVDILNDLDRVHCIFADPPDNLGLKYDEYDDCVSSSHYEVRLESWVDTFIGKAGITWISFNSRWLPAMGRIAENLLDRFKFTLELKTCVQTFTFGQHNHHDLGNCYRPLWRFRWANAPLYPDAIRVPSWRQQNGDKRADPRGRVPGDVFDFPRVTGNSKQRRKWHPTQLHEDLVERCIKLSTKEGDHVIDPFAGTGTTLRVCKRMNRSCMLIDISPEYCFQIGRDNLDVNWN